MGVARVEHRLVSGALNAKENVKHPEKHELIGSRQSFSPVKQFVPQPSGNVVSVGVGVMVMMTSDVVSVVVGEDMVLGVPVAPGRPPM